MADKTNIIINTLDNGNQPLTLNGQSLELGVNGDMAVHDPAKAQAIKEQNPWVELVPNYEQTTPGHPMRVMTIGLPWKLYDERGRVIGDKNGNLDTPSPTT